MELITIQVNDKEKARLLLDLFQSIDFVTIVDAESVEPLESEANGSSMESHDSAFGMWRDTDITAESLRENAWRRRMN